MEPLLEISRVKKSFDGAYALNEVNFDIRAGECIALVGENGAGKSTLMKILSGVWPHGSFEGELRFEGKPLRLTSPMEGRKHGISIIHQELCLFPQLTVAENLFLTEGFPYDGKPSLKLSEVIHWDSMFAQAKKLFDELGFDVDPRAIVNDLSVAKRQLVEIARAFHHKARLLILDEPTSALSTQEVENLFRIIREWRTKKMSFVYISHKLDEVFALADRILVLRDGASVAELDPKGTTEQEVIRHMVGRPLRAATRHEPKKNEEKILAVEALSHKDRLGRPVLENIEFELRKGEILGVAGLMGSGRSELLRSILGVLPGKRTGKMQLAGKPVAWGDIDEAMADGVAFVPEDRKKDGLFLGHGIDFNLTISLLPRLCGKLGVLDLFRERGFVRQTVQEMGVKCLTPRQAVRTLSGGNQQKVLLGKMVSRSPKVLLLDEPTRGIDIGAKEEIYQIIRNLAAGGMSIVMVSSELPEVLSLSDRVLVLKNGRLAADLPNVNLTQERIMEFAAGTG
jgi:D-xylose transport system ATP-binding protein